MKPSARLQLELEDVRRFHEALQPYIAAHHRDRDITGTFVFQEARGDEDEIERLRQELAAASGPAAAVAGRRGVHIEADGRRLNPIAAWDIFFDVSPVVWPSQLDAYSRALQARIESEVRLAQERERGLVGFLARFLRLPIEVREAAGLTGKPALAATGVTVAIQTILVGAAITVLGTLVLRLLGWTG